MAVAPTNLMLFQQTGSSAIVASWGIGSEFEPTLDHFDYRWFYTLRNSNGETGKYEAGSGQVERDAGMNHGGPQYVEWRTTYTPPDNWYRVEIRVFPVSKTYKQDDKDMSYWTGTTSWAFINKDTTRPTDPDKPSLIFGGVNSSGESRLLAQINVSDDRVTKVEFDFHWMTIGGNPSNTYRKVSSTPYNGVASCNINAPAGYGFVVRCRFINLEAGNYGTSEWSKYSDPIYTVPNSPTTLTAKASTKTSVYLKWTNPDSSLFTNASAVTDFEIEYTDDVNDFNDSATGGTLVKTGSLNPYYTVTGLEEGNEYFFRVRSLNDNGGSAWSNIASVVLGTEPNAPTTWSSSSTVIVGETLNLYWVHNSEDGSDARSSQLELTIGTETSTIDIPNTNIDDDDDENDTLFYSIDTSQYTEGTKVRWRVRTSGITEDYGDWSVRRTVDVYAQPSVVVGLLSFEGSAIDTISSFPLRIVASTSPSTQTPIGYSISIISNSTYDTRNETGQPIVVYSGDVVFEKYINSKAQLNYVLSAGDVILMSGVEYTFEVVAAMDSGLSATHSVTAIVSWTVPEYDLNTRMAYDPDNCTMSLIPYCQETDGSLAIGLSMSVYRIEYDGSMTLIAEDLNSSQFAGITDPHPSLNDARYRLVATDRNTGSMTFYDTPGYPVQEKCIIIQWDENWTMFDGNENGVLADPTWTGSIVKLPYNIDIQENTSSEVTLVNYIGRDYPVSYYGTAITSSSTWNVSVPMYDEDMLFSLRKLSKWTGDVYVREPSGMGYWANVAVSFNRKHLETAMPVTIEVTRVSGGA